MTDTISPDTEGVTINFVGSPNKPCAIVPPFATEVAPLASAPRLPTAMYAVGVGATSIGTLVSEKSLPLITRDATVAPDAIANPLADEELTFSVQYN